MIDFGLFCFLVIGLGWLRFKKRRFFIILVEVSLVVFFKVVLLELLKLVLGWEFFF